MGKTYIDTIKYIIYADYEIDGIVEKPDIIGAIFGQTEGLLGKDLDLRELQKSGRIGRIEVSTKNKDGKTFGVIEVPSSLDSVNTSILAAGVEAVDRIGPCKGNVKVTNIDDIRTDKRTKVVSRAQELLKNMMSGKGLESREISDTVRESSKAAGVTLYGPEKIAAGPDIDGKEIIIVEGRADVITMLKAGIKNVIALQGKKIPKSVIGLVRGKEATVFIDGDRGGDLIIRQLATVIKINYISKAPDGKEVEELTQKEILKCLKKRMTYPMFMKSITGQRTSTYQQRPTTQRPTTQRYQPRPFLKREPMVRKEIPFQADIKKLEGSLTATIIDSKKKKKEKIEVKNLTKEIEKAKDVKSIIFDGVITQRLVDLAKEKKVETIVGIKKGKIDNTGDVKVYTLN